MPILNSIKKSIYASLSKSCQRYAFEQQKTIFYLASFSNHKIENMVVGA